MIITNGIVQDVGLGIAENGFCLTLWVDIKLESECVRTLGDIVLGGLPDAKVGTHFEQPNIAAEFVVGLLRVCGANQLDDCRGKAIRVQRGHSSPGARVHQIGHIIDEDKWFNPLETSRSMKRGFENYLRHAGGGDLKAVSASTATGQNVEGRTEPAPMSPRLAFVKAVRNWHAQGSGGANSDIVKAADAVLAEGGAP